MYGIDDELAAYHFNRAVWFFGTSYEADVNAAIDAAKGKNGAKRAMAVVDQRWLNDNPVADDISEFEVVRHEEQEYLDPGLKFSKG